MGAYGAPAIPEADAADTEEARPLVPGRSEPATSCAGRGLRGIGATPMPPPAPDPPAPAAPPDIAAPRSALAASPLATCGGGGSSHGVASGATASSYCLMTAAALVWS